MATLTCPILIMFDFSPTERQMWQQVPSERKTILSDSEINEKYNRSDFRIVTETNREQLPNFVAALKRPGWIKLQPFYQRRQRWDVVRQSKLIESFIMNVPIPPCFLFESDFARYEVMDGQQRITAIQEFYGNKFKLKGLEQWPELNGRNYDSLPTEIRNGLDRRSVSYFVLLKESARTSDVELLLRQQVFERLNTGGVELENQEVRHCIYHNEFDQLLMDLSKCRPMRLAWDLPLWSSEEENKIPAELLDSPHYSKMQDVEFVLRFFALRHMHEYRLGMQGFLDLYMVRSRTFDRSDIEHLRAIFSQTIDTAFSIYGETLFKPWDVTRGNWSRKPQIAYADAVMVGICKHLKAREKMIHCRDVIIERSKQLLIDSSQEKIFTGQKNTKAAVIQRLTAFDDMLGVILA
jgi:hypothetical protein